MQSTLSRPVSQLVPILSQHGCPSPSRAPWQREAGVSCPATVMTPACIHTMPVTKPCQKKWPCSEITPPCPTDLGPLSFLIHKRHLKCHPASFPVQQLGLSPLHLQGQGICSPGLPSGWLQKAQVRSRMFLKMAQ